MVTIIKHEWHSVDSQFVYELDIDLLGEIYPDLDDEELEATLKQIEDGEIDIEDVINAAYDNNVEIEWDRQYDDWYTERKGGYDVTYEIAESANGETI